MIPPDTNRPCKGPAGINANQAHARIRHQGHHLDLPEGKYILKETAHHRAQKQQA